jgi:hypothetical protein
MHEAERQVLAALCEKRGFKSLRLLEAIWERKAGNLGLRAELYERNRLAYWIAYCRMITQGVYGRRTRGGLGLRGIAKDVAVGLRLSFKRGMAPGDRLVAEGP